MARRVSLEIVGDSSSLERAFANASNAARKFNQQVGTSTRQSGIAQLKEQAAVAKGEERMFKLRARRAASLGPFRLAGVGLGAGTALFAATQAVRELGQSLETTGAEAFTTTGRLKNMVSSLTSGDLVGAARAIGRQAKTMEDLGLQLYQVKQRAPALKDVAAGAGEIQRSLSSMTLSTTKAVQENQRWRDTTVAAGTASQETAKNVLEQAAAIEKAAVNTRRLQDEIDKLGQLFVTQSGALVRFTGYMDDYNRVGRGEPRDTGIPTPTPTRFAMPAAFLSPSQRRELDLIGQEGTERLAGLQDRLRQLQGQLEAGTSTNKQRLRISENIRNTEAEIAAIYKDQAAAQKAAAEEARRRAEAARQEALRREQERELRILAGPIPTRANLIKQFAAIQKSAAADRDFPNKLLERFAGVARLLREEITPETREAINAFFETVRGEFDKGKSMADPLAGLVQASTRQLTALAAAGTGLKGVGLATLAGNISGLQARQPIVVSMQVDGREIGRAATTAQARTGKRTARQTSGSR